MPCGIRRPNRPSWSPSRARSTPASWSKWPIGDSACPLRTCIRANERLALGGEVTSETAKRMGLFVVGRLARRHEATVRLRVSAPLTGQPGVTASVYLPGALIAAPAEVVDTLDDPYAGSFADAPLPLPPPSTRRVPDRALVSEPDGDSRDDTRVAGSRRGRCLGQRQRTSEAVAWRERCQRRRRPPAERTAAVPAEAAEQEARNRCRRRLPTSPLRSAPEGAPAQADARTLPTRPRVRRSSSG